MPSRFSKTAYVFILLTALSFGVHVLVTLVAGHASDPMHLDFDEQDYYGLAGKLIRGDYSFDIRRPPIHVLILALLRLVSFDNLLLTQTLVSLVFSLTGPLMYLLAKRMTGHNSLALTVGVLTIFWPPFLYYGSTLYSETTVLPVFVLVLILIPRGSVFTIGRPSGLLQFFIAGIVLGICMLVRPMYLLFGPFALMILFLEERNWSVATRRSIVFALGCFLVVLPWSTYISLKAGRPILGSANGGETLAGGLNPVLIEKGYRTYTAINGRQFWVGPGKWLNEKDNGYLNEQELKLPYAKQGILQQQRTLAWVFQNPSSALYLERAKLLYMWAIYPFWNNEYQTFLGNIPTLVFMILSIMSLIRFRSYLRQLSRFLVLPVFVSTVALISWGSWRFRQPGDLGLIMFSGLFVWSMFEDTETLMHHPERQKECKT